MSFSEEWIVSSEESDSGVGSNSTTTTTAEQEKLSWNKGESKFVQSHSLLSKAEILVVCAIFLLTAITDYIQVARRKEPVLGQLGVNGRSRLNPAASELDSLS